MSRSLVVSSGRGPVECRRAVRAVSLALAVAAEEAGLSADIIERENPDGEGPVSARVLLDGEGDLQPFLAGWLGSVQWIARSDRRDKAARKNWFVGVSEQEVQTAGPQVKAEDIEFSAITSGGPGGQHQNKTASAIRAVHRPTGTMVVVRSERSQHRNKSTAAKRIAAILAAKAADAAIDGQRRDWEKRISFERGNPVRVIRA